MVVRDCDTKMWLGVLLFVAGTLGAGGDVYGGWQVWTVAETRRVLREEPAGQNLPVNLAAARNERESFQILLRSNTPVAAVNVEAGDLRGPEGAVLRAADAQLFRQHQLHLDEGTYRNDQFKPGWYPDALVPFVHPLTREPLKGARLTAVPFDLPAHETHGFWVDLFVPPDARPGQYAGAYRVTAAGGQAVEIPVTLTVWDFALPRVSTMQTALGSPADQLRGYYRQRANDGKEEEPKDWGAVERQCAEMLSQHRINATPPQACLTPKEQGNAAFSFSQLQVRALREFVDHYHVNAIQIPHPDHAIQDPEGQREKLRAWLASWDRAATELDRPQVTFYTYLLDEPNDEKAYRYVQKWGRAIRDARSVVKVLVVEQPWTQDEKWGDLFGAVDIWCPLFSLFTPESAAKRQALGETIWTYTALCQGDKTPWWHTDFPLLHYRVPAWIAWRYRIRGLLYWGGMSYWEQVDDPWTDPKTYDMRREGKGLLYNGEGSLVYPGRAVGYDGIASSLRLKALRDAVEDYAYLAILERRGLAAEAEKVVVPLAGSWYKWESDPATYQEARAQLAEMIVAGEKR